jgi:Cellulose binding domain
MKFSSGLAGQAGGSGESLTLITGIRTMTFPFPPSLTPEVTSMRSNLQRCAIISAAMALCTGVFVVAPLVAAPPAAAASSCSAAYTVTSQWSDGFGASITITNTGPAITAWTLQYTYPGNQRLSDGWDGSWSQSGETVAVTNASWNGTLAAGASTTIGANFSYSGTNDAPASISCAGNGSSGGGTGGQASFTQADINAAVAAPLIAFAAPTAAVPRPGTSPTNIYEAKVLYYLALVEYEHPDATASNGTTVESALLAQVANLVAGGNEPDADGGLEGWAHAPVAQALLLLKNGPAWNALPTTEQSKVSLLEAAMGYAGNYTYNDANNFSSGICGYGDFSKTNNPNYEDGYVDVELAAIEFFGPGTWDTMLTDFNDATVTSELDAAGLTNAGGCFATAGSAADAATTKAAIDIPFVWKGIPATNPMGIWNQLASDTFNNTVTSSVTGVSNGVTVTAAIADGTTSPYEGECCMGHEFDSTDADGLRSSALYVYEGWMNVTGSRVALTALGAFDCASAPAAAQYDVGSQDLIYKLNHGYISYAQSQDGILVDDIEDPASDGPVAKGWAYDIDAYNALAAPSSC